MCDKNLLNELKSVFISDDSISKTGRISKFTNFLFYGFELYKSKRLN